MPLLKRQPFVRVENPTGIENDDRVFYCEATGEIFRDYEHLQVFKMRMKSSFWFDTSMETPSWVDNCHNLRAFFERVVLCNTLQWSCAVTGRPGLTFEEATSSERKATAYANSLPQCIKLVYLFLMSLTKRRILAEANDEIFSFVRQRFFIGETVEVMHKGEKRPCDIISIQLVMPDKTDEASSPEQKDSTMDPGSYLYTVKEPKEGCEPFTVKFDVISRRKGVLAREKGRLFLKLNCTTKSGIWVLKDSTPDKFNLAKFHFYSYFPGPVPAFAKVTAKEEVNLAKKQKASARKTSKGASSEKDKGGRPPKKKSVDGQGKLKPLQPVPAAPEQSAEGSGEISESMLTAEEREAMREILRLERVARKEALLKKAMEERAKRRAEKAQEKLKLLQERREQAEKLKEWNRLRDDMECDDLEVLPEPRDVYTRTPNSLFGDMVSVLEFCNTFQDSLTMESRFPNGLTFETLDRALTDTDMNGPLGDILNCLLSSVFEFQGYEDEETSAQILADDDSTYANDTVEEELETDVSYQKLIKSATAASQIPLLCHGANLKEFPMAPLTISEVLKLHILGSGAQSSTLSSKFRYQQRGGYCPRDDAGLELKRNHSNLLKQLVTGNVFDLPPEGKLKVLSVLTQQLMSYATLRDVMDDSFNNLKIAKANLRHLYITQQRKEKEEAIQRSRKRAEQKLKESDKHQIRLSKINALVANGMSPAEANQTIEQQEVESDEYKEAKVQARKYINKVLSETVKLNPAPPVVNEHRTRRKADQVDFHEFDDIDWDAIDDTLLTQEESETIATRKREYEIRCRQEFLDQEKELRETIHMYQQESSIYSLGQDRFYRTYWLFPNLPGLYVEENDSYHNTYSPSFEEDDVSSQGDSTQQSESTKDAESATVSQCSSQENLVNGSETVTNGTERSLTNGIDSSVPMDCNGDLDVSASPERQETPGPPDAMDVDESGVEAGDKGSAKESVKAEAEKTCTMQPGESRWRVYSSMEDLHALINNLNRRGVRESSLRSALTDRLKFLEQAMTEAPDFLSVPIRESGGHFQGQQAVMSRNKMMQGLVKNKSALENMELNLREMLLDIEERVYAGSLGAIKIDNRPMWRDAIERGSYDPQDEAIAAKVVLPVCSGLDESEISDELTASQVVRDLSHALLQIESCIDKKYLAYPLGNAERKDSSKRKKAGTLEEDDMTAKIHSRWRETLASATSISQILLYLATLEGSIVWSRSALNARCHLCSRKGDAERMLLCDSCDRGHHMYCLKPVVKQIPQGDWFCPSCRPKKAKPQRVSRRSFCEPDSDQLEDSEEESSFVQDSASVDEEVMMNPKIKLLKGFGARSSRDSSPMSRGGSKKTSRRGTPEPTGAKRSANASPDPVAARKKGRWSDPGAVAKNNAEGQRVKRKYRKRGQSAGGGVMKKPGPKPGSKYRKTLKNKAGPKPKIKAGAKLFKTKPGPKPGTKFAQKASAKKALSARKAAKREADGEVEASPALGKRRKRTESAPGMSNNMVNGGGDESSRGKGHQRGLVTEVMKAMAKCEEIIRTLSVRKDAWPFAMPVSKKEVPDYYKIIKRPMDFSTIKSKMKMVNYSTPQEIVADVRLMFRNCEAYNREDSDIFQTGQKLSRMFENKIKSLNLKNVPNNI